MPPAPRFETLVLSAADAVAVLELNRPEKANAMDLRMWAEIGAAMAWIDEAAAVRVAVIRGAGKHFCAGIDLDLLRGVREQVADPCPGRAAEKLRRLILEMQDALNAIERCRKPVLAAVHGMCVGAGVDLVAACDMRYCVLDAQFSIREVDVGMAADLGTLQRLPRLIGEGMARELAYTGRNVSGAEAKEIGLANRCYIDGATLLQETAALAATIAAKSPLAVRGCKEMITYARDHSIADGLNYVATWNAAMLMSADIAEAIDAARERREPRFRD